DALGHLARLAQDRYVLLPENRHKQSAIRRESQTVGSLPSRRCIRPDHVAEQHALAVLVAINVAGQRLVRIEQPVRAKRDAVREFDASVEFLYFARPDVDSID